MSHGSGRYRVGAGAALLLVVVMGVLGLIQACTIKDVTSVALGSVTVQPGSASLVVGQSAPFSAVVRDEQGTTLTGASVTWSSGTPTVVSVDPDGTAHALAPGSAVVRATFRDMSGTASVTVGPGPSIAASPGEVAFSGAVGGAAPSPRGVQITNGGGGTLQGLLATVEFASGQPTGWLTASLGASAAPTTLTLTPVTAAVPAGSYTATVVVSAQGASNSPLSIPVTLTLSEGRAIIALDPAAVDLEATAGGNTADVQVTNAGGGDLTDLSATVWYAAVGGAWLSASLSGTTAPAQLHIEAHAAGLSPGTYEAEVRVASPVAVNSPKPVAVTFTVAATADVAIDKSGPTSALEGERLTYTLKVTNAGPDAADGVVAVDSLPPGTTLASTSAGTVDNGVVEWDVGSLAAGASAEATIVVDLTAGTTGAVRNVARVSSSTADSDPSNDVSQVVTNVGALVLADLGVKKSGPASAVAGTDVTYTIEASNAGPAGGQDVIVLDTIPAGTRFKSATAGTESSGVLRWNIGSLASGATRTLQVTVTVDAATRGTVVNRAWIDGSSTDRNSANDGAGVSTSVVAPPGITIVGGPLNVSEAGTSQTFTVALAAVPATDVVLTVTSSDTGEATVSPSTLTFTNATSSTPQTVTVTGVDDDIIDGPQTSTVTVAVNDALSDDAYDPVPDALVTVTTSDNDAPGFTIAQSGGSTVVAESGTTDDFTVVLNAQPASNVVFRLTASDATEATVSPATLTFTPSDWNVAQTVTVTGVDDFIDDGDRTSTVTVSVDDALSADTYDPLPDQVVSVTTTDNDAVGFTITAGALSVSETGTTATFTVVLTAQPATSDVVLSVTSGDTGEATVSPATLTFTGANWNVAQTVTVTGVDDTVVDGNQVTTLTVGVVAASSDDQFDGVANQTRPVTTTDNETAGFSVSAATLTVAEGGAPGTFTVVLTAQPVSNVVFDVSSADATQVTVSPATLTFTNGTWNTPQTVTVTAVDDPTVDGSVARKVTVAVNDAASQDQFDVLANKTVDVTATDNDVAGFTVTGGPLTVAESGTSQTFTVVLDRQPVTNVVFGVSSNDASESSPSPTSLTFTNGNWNVAQTVTVTGVNDFLIDGPVGSTITVAVNAGSSDDAWDALAAKTVSVTTTDDDVAGLNVSATAVTVSEAGPTSQPFTVALTSQPTSNVVLSVTASDATEATASPATLTFTNANWNVAQTVTVTGVNDFVHDGDQTSTVTVSVVDGSSDATYGSVADKVVTVTTKDDDVVGFVVADLDSRTVSESGTYYHFTVALTAQPTTNVVMSITTSDPTETSVAPATLTFTNANWNVPQRDSVKGVDDVIVDGPQTSTITIAVAAGSDAAFIGLAPQTRLVTTTDNDGAGFTVTQTGGSTTVSETGTTDQFSVVLTAAPSSNVVIDVSSGDTGEATVSPASLTFAPGTWNVAQTVTVTGVDDDVVDGPQTTAVTLAVNDALSDDLFDPVANQTVSVTTTDNETAGFNLSTAGPIAVSETGSTGAFTAVLTGKPLSPVTLDVSSSDTGEATVSPSSVTFTPGNWDTPQSVTVTGVDDAIVDGTVTSTVTVSVNDAASDDLFDPVADKTVSVTTADDETAGFTVTGGPLTVSETGTSQPFTVVLTGGQPASNVVFDVSSNDATESSVSPTTLTFTSANWNVPQTVNVTGVDDPTVDGDVGSTVTVAVNDAASLDAFDPLPDKTVGVTTTDDDAAGFSVTGGPLTVNESAPGNTGTFSVVLTAQPLTNVVFSVTSGDTGEATVSTGTLTFTPGGWNAPQSVTVTGVPDGIADGDQTITVTVSVTGGDVAFGGLADQTVSVTVKDTADDLDLVQAPPARDDRSDDRRVAEAGPR